MRWLLTLLLVCSAVSAKDTLTIASAHLEGRSGIDALRPFAEVLSKRADVIVVQGAFDGGDLRALNELFENAELIHTQSWTAGWGGGSGLLIASRYPLQDGGYTAFEWAGKPHKPWHRDYYRNKGVGLVTVDSPWGEFWLGATALHAHHADEEYRWLRIHQALEVADTVGNHGVIPPESARDSGRLPLVVAAALDCDRGELPLRVLVEASGAEPVRDAMGPSWILTRAGGLWGLRVKRVRPLFDEGERPGWVAEFRKRRFPNGPPLASAAPFRETADELLPLVREEADVAREEGNRATFAGLGLFLMASALYAIGWILGRPPARKPRKRKRRPSDAGATDSGSGATDSGAGKSTAERRAPRKRRRRGCCLFGCLSLIVAHGALWLIYQGRVFVPYELGGLESTASRLEPPEVMVIEGGRK